MGGLPVFSKRSVRAMLISARALPGSERKMVRDVLFDGGDFSAGLFEVFLQLEGIALDGEIEVADGKSADNVADSAAGEVEIHARGAGYVLDEADALQLVRRQPDFHRVNVVSHSLSSGCPGPVAGRELRCKIAAGEGRPTELSTRFPQPGHRTPKQGLQPLGCKWLKFKVLRRTGNFAASS